MRVLQNIILLKDMPFNRKHVRFIVGSKSIERNSSKINVDTSCPMSHFFIFYKNRATFFFGFDLRD